MDVNNYLRSIQDFDEACAMLDRFRSSIPNGQISIIVIIFALKMLLADCLNQAIEENKEKLDKNFVDNFLNKFVLDTKEMLQKMQDGSINDDFDLNFDNI